MTTVAHFLSVYGPELFDSGRIWWWRFVVLMKYAPNAMAFQRMHNTRAIALGTAQGQGSQDATRFIEQDRREAFGI